MPPTQTTSPSFIAPTETSDQSGHLRILKSLAARSGSHDFFPCIVRLLATCLKVQIVFVAELLPGNRAGLLAVWAGSGFARPFDYNLANTPSEAICNQGYLFVPDKLQDLYPDDPLLEVIGARSLRGITLRNRKDQVIGLLAVLGHEKMKDDDNSRELFELLAQRLGAELAKARSDRTIRMIAAAAEQTSDEILITDAQGVIEYVNPAFESSTGFSRAEAIGQKPNILKSGIHNDDFYTEMWKTISTGRHWNGRIHNRTKEGRIIVQDASVTALRDANRGISGFVSTRRDVTQLIGEEVRVSRSQRLEAIGTLTSGIAHDFNNVLAAILALAHVALLDTRKNAKAYRPLVELVEAAKRAAELVKQILAFSRSSESVALPIQPKLILSEALRFLRASIPATIEIEKRIESDGIVIADPSDIQRILINLCTNSALAMTGKLGLLEVELTDYEPEGDFLKQHQGTEGRKFLRLRVRDTGCGIAPEIMGQVFEPFFTTRAASDGTGMGLAVVRSIVEKCHGCISLKSDVGKGSTFDVYLPEASAAQAPDSAVQPMIAGTARILFVDDEPRFGQTAARILGKIGYEVTPYESGIEALKAFKAMPSSFDLVICDVTMPKMTGHAFTSEIKRIRRDLPVILYTGYSDAATAATAKAAGADALLLKPVDWGRLSKIVQEHLGLQRQEEAVESSR